MKSSTQVPPITSPVRAGMGRNKFAEFIFTQILVAYTRVTATFGRSAVIRDQAVA